MLKRLGILMLAGFAIVSLLAACGGSGGNGGTSDVAAGSACDGITIKATEMKYVPNNCTVKAGQKVTINIENTGTVLHDFTINDLNGEKISQQVEPGKTETVTFTAPSSPGQIDFHCSQPGHMETGMAGTITVQ